MVLIHYYWIKEGEPPKVQVKRSPREVGGDNQILKSGDPELIIEITDGMGEERWVELQA